MSDRQCYIVAMRDLLDEGKHDSFGHHIDHRPPSYIEVGVDQKLCKVVSRSESGTPFFTH